MGGLDKIFNIAYEVRDLLFMDGRKKAEEIRNKHEKDREWWESIYLWFHDNFEYIIIIGGCIILVLLLISFLRDNTDNIGFQKQKGGAGEGDNEDGQANFVPLSKDQLKNRAEIADAKKKAQNILEGKGPVEKSTSQKMKDRFLLGKSKENWEAAKASIKNAPGKLAGKVSEKTGKAWKSVKSGEALALGKEKFENGIGDVMNSAKQNAKKFYAYLFLIFIVTGFGLFFVPTFIMVILSLGTLMIFNKQKERFLEST